MPGGPVLGVIDAKTNTWLQNVNTNSNSHSIAVDPATIMCLCRCSQDHSAPRKARTAALLVTRGNEELELMWSAATMGCASLIEDPGVFRSNSGTALAHSCFLVIAHLPLPSRLSHTSLTSTRLKRTAALGGNSMVSS